MRTKSPVPNRKHRKEKKVRIKVLKEELRTTEKEHIIHLEAIRIIIFDIFLPVLFQPSYQNGKLK